MKNRMLNLFFLTLVALTVGVSIWGPEALSNYQDRYFLGKTHCQQVEISGEGFRYEMSPAEKLFVLSRAMTGQKTAEEGFKMDDRGEASFGTEWGGTYALVVNHRGPGKEEVSSAEIYGICNEGLKELKAAGILPESVLEVDPELYDAVLYSAIDVREPRNSVAVWQVSLSDSRRDVRKDNRLMEAYVDAEDGKIYQFYARTEREWEDLNPDELIQSWSRYLKLPLPLEYKEASPLSEATPYFKKYEVLGNLEEKTVVTVGFYEGIREMFVRIEE